MVLRDLNKLLWGVVLILVIVVSFFTFSIINVFGYSWYPSDCCSGKDCDVAKIVMTFDFWFGDKERYEMMINVMGRNVMVPINFPRRESKDSQMHACIRLDTSEIAHLRCLFMPPVN